LTSAGRREKGEGTKGSLGRGGPEGGLVSGNGSTSYHFLTRGNQGSEEAIVHHLENQKREESLQPEKSHLLLLRGSLTIEQKGKKGSD